MEKGKVGMGVPSGKVRGRSVEKEEGKGTNATKVA